MSETKKKSLSGPSISMGVLVGTALGATLGGILLSRERRTFSRDLRRLRGRVRELQLSLLTEELASQQAQ